MKDKQEWYKQIKTVFNNVKDLKYFRNRSRNIQARKPHYIFLSRDSN